MTEHVLFIQGAGRGAYDEDTRLAESLRHTLGPRFEVRYPAMPNEDDATYEPWREQIAQELADMPGPGVIVGHSVGASVLMKWLSERTDEKAIAGVFLSRVRSGAGMVGGTRATSNWRCHPGSLPGSRRGRPSTSTTAAMTRSCHSTTLRSTRKPCRGRRRARSTKAATNSTTTCPRWRGT